jgi:hypothetical protein
MHCIRVPPLTQTSRPITLGHYISWRAGRRRKQQPIVRTILPAATSPMRTSLVAYYKFRDPELVKNNAACVTFLMYAYIFPDR